MPVLTVVNIHFQPAIVIGRKRQEIRIRTVFHFQIQYAIPVFSSRIRFRKSSLHTSPYLRVFSSKYRKHFTPLNRIYDSSTPVTDLILETVEIKSRFVKIIARFFLIYFKNFPSLIHVHNCGVSVTDSILKTVL